jgi:hypothetical protein
LSKKKRGPPRKDENNPHDKNKGNGTALPCERAILFIDADIAYPSNGF